MDFNIACDVAKLICFFADLLHIQIRIPIRCAWLGELDSAEESDEISNEFDFKNEVSWSHWFTCSERQKSHL